MKTQQKNTHKKLFSLMSVILATVLVTIYSCKKEATQPERGNTFGLSLAKAPSSNSGQRSLGGATCLAFATIAGYESAITQPPPQIQTSLSGLINSFSTFTSYTKACPNDTLFGDPAITEILNQDAVIQIAGYYFKIDPVLEKVFVLPITDAAYYGDLISTYPQSGKVTMFSAKDDVLGLIGAGAMLNTQLVTINLDSVIAGIVTERGLLKNLYVKVVNAINSSPLANSLGVCEDPTAQHDNQTKQSEAYTTLYDKTKRILYTEVRYRNLGIYFSATLKGYLHYDTGAPVQDITTLYASVYYKVRCREGAEYQKTIQGSKGRDATYTVYQGVRALAYYQLSAYTTNTALDPTRTGGVYVNRTHTTPTASIRH